MEREPRERRRTITFHRRWRCTSSFARCGSSDLHCLPALLLFLCRHAGGLEGAPRSDVASSRSSIAIVDRRRLHAAEAADAVEAHASFVVSPWPPPGGRAPASRRRSRAPSPTAGGGDLPADVRARGKASAGGRHGPRQGPRLLRTALVHVQGVLRPREAHDRRRRGFHRGGPVSRRGPRG